MWLVFSYPPDRAIAFGVDYFLSALFSFLIFTPLVAAWPVRISAGRAKRWLFAGAMLVIAVAGWAVLRVDPVFQDRLLFLLLPFVVVCAVAAGVGGASAASALLAMVMTAMAQQAVPVADSILRSLFAVIATLTGYLIAVVFSEREGTASEMDYRARHDVLTGLINRYEFDNRITAALRDTDRRHAVLYLDLDQFKLVNDTCGHLAGDHMLRQLAKTIERSLPEGAALARLGGDEFACLLPDATENKVDWLARSLHDVVRAFEFPVGELRFRVGVSIGTTFLSAADDRGSDDALAAPTSPVTSPRSAAAIARMPMTRSMRTCMAGIRTSRRSRSCRPNFPPACSSSTASALSGLAVRTMARRSARCCCAMPTRTAACRSRACSRQPSATGSLRRSIAGCWSRPRNSCTPIQA
jgi:diguanylate cyclase (GGDEF)-like protein